MADEKEPLFLLIVKLAEKDGVSRIHQLPGCWTRKVGKEWWFAVNGHTDAVKVVTPDKVEHEVKPFNCYVEFNGWPAGVFDPYGGVIAAGALANEETFAAAIEKELAA